jgi:hypothetical protein
MGTKSLTNTQVWVGVNSFLCNLSAADRARYSLLRTELEQCYRYAYLAGHEDGYNTAKQGDSFPLRLEQ